MPGRCATNALATSVLRLMPRSGGSVRMRPYGPAPIPGSPTRRRHLLPVPSPPVALTAEGVILIGRPMSLLERAIGIAVEAHRGQTDRYRAPYILHPLRVMGRVETEQEKLVAILHDVVEDTHWTLAELRREGFSEEVLAALDAVTKRDGEAYEDFVGRSAGNALARRVKLADLEDNMDLRRLPELYCGFQRGRQRGPTLYPVACSPQAWAAGTPLLLLQASLGLEFDSDHNEILLRNPRLPTFLDEVALRNLRLGKSVVDLTLRRHGNDVSLQVLRNEGHIRVAAVYS